MKTVSTFKRWQVGLHYEEIIKVRVEWVCDYLKVQFIARDDQGEEIILLEGSRDYYMYFDPENFQRAMEIIREVTGKEFIEVEMEVTKTIFVREDFAL